MEEEKIDITYIEDEVLETKLEDGKIQIYGGMHSFSKRAKQHKRLDKVTLEELNVALEYFDYRCVYTGQKFVTFEEKASKKKSNLSVDHVIALVSGGHNIAQNMLPSILQYNISKNGYHLLDWYKMQETPSGEKIYNPYRLLKIYNYMSKSLSAMDLKGEEYRQAILSKNDIDNYLETKKEEIYSDEITTYEVDEDGTNLLQKIPTINGSITHLEDEQKIQYSDIELSGFMNNMLLELQDSIDKSILQKARDIFENLSNREKVFERIPKEEKAQAEVIEYLKTLGCESSYTIARTIDISKIMEQDISAEQYLKPKIEKIRKYLDGSNIQSLSIGTILDNIPQIIESENISEAFLSLGIEVPEHMEEFQRLGANVREKSIQNINTALKIVNEYNFEESIGRKITAEEKKILVESILAPARLNSGKKPLYISTLYKNIREKEMDVQEAYGAIINYALGNNGQYSMVILSANKIQEELRTEVSEEDINQMLMNNGIILQEDKKQIEELRVDVTEKDVRNINAALKIVNEYNFEESIGRKITDEEKKILVESILAPVALNSGRGCNYISTLYKNITENGKDSQEAYGAIINYAIGNNRNYVGAIGNKNKIAKKLRTEVSEEDINQMLMNNGIILQEDKKQIEELRVDVTEKDVRNINTALKIVNEYNFEEGIGRKITDEEKKILVESILAPAFLNSGRGCKYISTLYKNITEKGMDSQEAYGAIINYAMGKNRNYAGAIGSNNKIEKELITEVSEEDINQMLMNNGIILQEDKKQIEELRVEVTEKDVRNINAALKIVNEYNFEEGIGRKITAEEKKILVESILAPARLNSGKKPLYISTLYKNITEKGIDSQEAYGAIINYAIGNNGGYERAIVTKNKIAEELKTKVSEEDIVYMLMNNITVSEEYRKQIEELRVDVTEKDVRNINAALKIVNEYNFEESIRRKITAEEKKMLVESILAPVSLNSGKKASPISMLYKNITEKGIGSQEAYGAIINYAIGNNGNYAGAIGTKNKIAEELKTKVSEEDIVYMLMNNITVSEEYRKQIEELRVDVTEKDVRNINAALKIVDEYIFEESIGRKITDEEKKILVESILAPARLNSGIGCNYLSTVYKNIAERGMKSQEAYGAIINYAMGNNGNYSAALGNKNKIAEELITEVSEEDINQILMNNGIILQEDKKQIEELRVDVTEKDVRNINSALKIVNEYNFEESIGRKITAEEKKILVESILAQVRLNSGKNPSYISTLYKNIAERGMDSQDAYGAIINYAIGNNGSYKEALGNKNKIAEELITEVSEEDINQMLKKKKDDLSLLEKEKQEKIKTLEDAQRLERKIDIEISKVKQRKNDEVVR